jgi:hypothetical protein
MMFSMSRFLSEITSVSQVRPSSQLNSMELVGVFF